MIDYKPSRDNPLVIKSPDPRYVVSRQMPAKWEDGIITQWEWHIIDRLTMSEMRHNPYYSVDAANAVARKYNFDWNSRNIARYG